MVLHLHLSRSYEAKRAGRPAAKPVTEASIREALIRRSRPRFHAGHILVLLPLAGALLFIARLMLMRP
ncbi:hypothetical protein [Methylobacterium nigriterrae]|uniref:hypothetical protein n=1 Tax=Methylobacterium nigriterrae TaxID=3127512 RepID=UPI0030134AAA